MKESPRTNRDRDKSWRSLIDAAVEIVSGDDRGTALGIFVGGTVLGIVAALDASARTTGFNELDVVFVA